MNKLKRQQKIILGKNEKGIYSAVTNRIVKPGTSGVILGLRSVDNQALVKFKGFSWPLSVSQNSLLGR